MIAIRIAMLVAVVVAVVGGRRIGGGTSRCGNVYTTPEGKLCLFLFKPDENLLVAFKTCTAELGINIPFPARKRNDNLLPEPEERSNEGSGLRLVTDKLMRKDLETRMKLQKCISTKLGLITEKGDFDDAKLITDLQNKVKGKSVEKNTTPAFAADGCDKSLLKDFLILTYVQCVQYFCATGLAPP